MVKVDGEEYFLTGKIIKFEDKMAIVKTQDGFEISWPIKDLPEDVVKDSEVRLDLSTSSTNDASKQKIAKAILNEILKHK